MQKTIETIKRLSNSPSGNPAYEITFTGGLTMRTKPNISDAYKICTSWEGRLVNIQTETTRTGKTLIVGID